MENILIINKDDLKKLVEELVKHLEDNEIIKQNGSETKEWLTNKEVCEFLSVNTRTMQNYRDKGIISFSKHGSKIYYQQKDIDAYLESHYQPAFNTGRGQS